jgi:hypothetical protein
MRRGHIGPARVEAAVLAGFVLLAALAFVSAWSEPVSQTEGVGLDSMNTMWFMRWVPFALTHAHNPLLTNWMYYPTGVSVMWNNADALPGLGLLTAPLQAVLPMTTVFNLVVTAGVGLSAWAAYLAIRRHVESRTASILGGLVYGFGPYMSAQWLGHMGLALAFIAPLSLMLLEDIVVWQRGSARRLGALLGLLAGVQVLLAEEMLASEVVVAAVLVLAMVALKPREVRVRIPFAARSLAWSLLVFALIAGSPLAEQFLGPHRLRGALRTPDIFVTDVLNLVLPTQALLLHPFGLIGQGFTGNATEWDGYLGVPLLAACALVAVRYRHRLDVRLAVVVGVVMTVLSFGPRVHIAGQSTGIPGLWHAGRIPILQNILPGRLMMLTDLAAGWLVAVLVGGVLRAPRTAPRLAAGGALAAVLLASLLPAWPVISDRHEVPAFFTGGGVKTLAAGSNVLIFPLPLGKDYDTNYAYQPLLWQVVANMRFRVPMFTAIVPGPDGKQLAEPDLGPMARAEVAIQDGAPAPAAPSDTERVVMIADLRARQVSTVLLGPMPRHDDVKAYVVAVLGPGEESGGVTLWRLDRI